MKKILFALALLASVVSCQKDDLDSRRSSTEENLATISIGVSTKSDPSDTKVGITTGDNAWDFKWTKGDKLGGHSFTYDDVSGWDTKLYPFEITTNLSGGDADFAEFTGDINIAKEKQRFIYPYADLRCTGGMPYLYLSKQTVDLTDPMANLANYTYMVSEGIYNTSDVDFGEIKMKHICGVLNLDINFINIPESGATLKKVKIAGMGDTHLNFGVQYDFKQEYQTDHNAVTRTSAMKFKDATNQIGKDEAEITIKNSPKLSADNSYNVPIAMFPARFYETMSGKDEVLNITVTYTVGDEEVEDEREVIVNWGDRSGMFSDLKRGEIQPMSVTCDLAEKKAPEVPDFTDPDGVFFLFEGNMTNSWGKIVYIDGEGTEWSDVFTMQNKGKVIGNVLQDMYIYKNRIYLLCQNGRDLGNGGAPSSNACGRLVVCDKNMKMLYADDLEIVSQEGDETWPQHLAIVNDKIYIQYSEVMEDYSGVYVLDIDEDGEGVTFDSYINDTFGVFTKTGATKARMVVSGNDIYMGRGTSFISINTTANDAVTVIKDFKSENADDQGSQVKDVVKTKDGDFFVAVSGEGTSEQYMEIMTTPSKIVCISKDGTVKSETELTKLNYTTYEYEFDPAIGFPINPASPSIGMCGSFKGNNLIFREQAQFMCTTVGQLSEDSYYGQLSYKENPLYIYDSYTPIYGYAGIANDEAETLYVTTSDNYSTGTITIYGPDGYGGYYSTGQKYEYNDMDHASPAGIDFGYRFTDEWIQK